MTQENPPHAVPHEPHKPGGSFLFPGPSHQFLKILQNPKKVSYLTAQFVTKQKSSSL